MTIFKNLFYIFFLLILSINILKAENKVSYIDIDYVLTNTLVGKSLLNSLKKEEELKIIIIIHIILIFLKKTFLQFHFILKQLIH